MSLFFYSYLDNCLKVIVTVFLADLLQRFFLALREYFLFPIHYKRNARLRKIFKYAFTYTSWTIGLYVMTAFMVLWRRGTSGYILVELPAWLLHAPILWILTWVGYNHSTLNYSHWIRDEHGLDYARCMASSYFHDELKLILPSKSDHQGIRARIALYEAKERVKFAINRLIILIPDTMFFDSKIEGKYLEKAKPMESDVRERGGIAHVYKNDVYRITINGVFYYIAVKSATPILTFFESMHFKLSSTWQMEEMRREIFLKFCMHTKKLLSEWPETEQKCELIIYESHTDDGRKQDVSEVILEHIQYLRSSGRA